MPYVRSTYEGLCACDWNVVFPFGSPYFWCSSGCFCLGYFYDIADKCNHIYCCHKHMSVSVLSIFFSWFYSRPVLASCLCSRLCVLCFIISSRNRTLASFIFSSRNRTLACYIFFTQTKETIVAKKWWS